MWSQSWKLSSPIPQLSIAICPARVALYRAFLKLWDSIAVNRTVETNPPSPASAVDRRLDAITPKPRQAFLLMALEGLSIAETAQVLNVPLFEAKALIDEAGTEIADQIAADILIIEDEPLIAMDLETLVKDLGHRLHGVARTHAEAVKAVAGRRPGAGSGRYSTGRWQLRARSGE